MNNFKKELLKEMIKDGDLKTTKDLHSYLKDLFKDTLQEMLEDELDMELGYSKRDRKSKNTDNRRNRNGDFEPAVVLKNKMNICGIEDKIISLYARGMSTRYIHNQINEIYGIEVLGEMVSKITDMILPKLRNGKTDL